MEQPGLIPQQINRETYTDRPLYVEFARQILSPPGDDARISLFFQGLLDVVHNRHVPDELQAVTAQNTQRLLNTAKLANDSSTYAANKILRCFQKQFMYRNSGTDYPFTDADVLPWRNAILTVMSSERFDEIMNDMVTRETQSNIVQRYNVLKFIIAACLDEAIEAPQVIDVGCSQNLGLKKIGINSGFETVRLAGSSHNGTDVSLRTLGQRYNRIISQPVRLGRSLGVDLFDMRKTSNVEWVHACSSYPSELLQTERLQETKELKSANLPEVSFEQVDITTYKPSRGNQQQFNDRRRYDVAFASTVMYQMTDAEREATFNNIYNHLKPGGLLVVQDFVKMKNNKLLFSGPGSDRYIYKTFIKDKRGNYDVPTEVFTWENARCTRVELGLGLLAIHGASMTVSGLLATLLKTRARVGP